MKLLTVAVLPFLLATSAAAQTTIGGGTCNSSTLNGTYALSLTGRQVNSSGTFLNVLQSNGSMTFDGQSTFMVTGTEDTNQAVGMAGNSMGTYSVQADCTAVLTASSGATFNLVIFNGGKNFALSGYDATYSYSGSGNLPAPQSITCSTATLNGMYTFDATGFTLSGNSITGAGNVAGLLQFDGQGNLTVNGSGVSAGVSALGTLTGTYTISSDCLGTAMLTDSKSHSLVMAFSIFTFTAANTNFFATLARDGHFLIAGTGHNLTTQTGTATCSTSSLNGTYPFNLSGRAISSSGSFTGSYQGIGTATFDGNGNVTLAGTANTNLAQRTSFSYSGTYTLPSSCSGMLTVTINGTATFALVVWGNGTQFAMIGSDATNTYSAGGSLSSPLACATATLSGEYTFTASGFTESGTTPTGAQDEAGVLQFDGQGNITAASYTDTQSGTMPVTTNTTGTYTVGPGCSASAALKDSSGNSTNLNFLIEGPHGENAEVLLADSQYVRVGSAHSAFTNPSQSIANVASYAYSYTPPGSVFVLFGQNLATKPAGAVTSTLPTKLLDTTVTVNGELAPLFYVEPGQIDAQMPWDIAGGAVASVIVANGSSTSNAAAVYVPATGTPGISTYGNNRAVVVNADGNVNSASDQASVGDEVVVYFTGGGPVMSQTTLTTGSPAGNTLAPLTEAFSITVGGVQAHVDYIGLTPESIGLYQANFNVPQLAKGAYPVVITINGQASNNPVMNVSN